MGVKKFNTLYFTFLTLTLHKKMMGTAKSGLPKEIILDLAQLSGAKVFVETGTFHGDTTRWAAKHFESVVTIERSESLYQEFSPGLRDLGNVKPLLGDSSTVLPQVVAGLGNQPAVFWLDGHWSFGATAGENHECPLLAELEALANRKGDIILIDDARLFLSAPPVPHDPAQWPTLPQIIFLLMKNSEQLFMQMVDDIIFIVPPEKDIKQHLIEYTSMRAHVIWTIRPNDLPRKIIHHLIKIAGKRLKYFG